MRLSEHFTLEEFLLSETATRLGIDNTPTDEIIENLKRTAKHMEDVRVRLGDNVISVSSGYRSWALNHAIGGSKKSYHPYGLAVDFNCHRFGKPLDVCRAIAETDIPFDQLIHEGGVWVHIGFALTGDAPRREMLTAFFPGPIYKQGLLPV